MKERILQMSREELVDFLAENWTEMTRKLPEDKRKVFFNNHAAEPDYTEYMRAVALELADQSLITA